MAKFSGGSLGGSSRRVVDEHSHVAEDVSGVLCGGLIGPGHNLLTDAGLSTSLNDGRGEGVEAEASPFGVVVGDRVSSHGLCGERRVVQLARVCVLGQPLGRRQLVALELIDGDLVAPAGSVRGRSLLVHAQTDNLTGDWLLEGCVGFSSTGHSCEDCRVFGVLELRLHRGELGHECSSGNSVTAHIGACASQGVNLGFVSDPKSEHLFELGFARVEHGEDRDETRAFILVFLTELDLGIGLLVELGQDCVAVGEPLA